MASSRLARKTTSRAGTWSRGDPITAKRLNQMSRNIDANAEGLTGPKQQGAKEESDAAPSMVFTEQSRTETTTEITDSNGDTFDLVTIDEVTFTSEDGSTLQLIFENP